MDNTKTQFSTIIAEEKSTHIVECFILGPLTKHPNADTLSIIKIGSTDFTYVAKTDEWKDKVGKLVGWVPPDSIIDTKRSEFTFLGDKNRVRARKIRGVNSYGVLVLIPESAKLKPGDNAAKFLDVTHYDPEGAMHTSKNSKHFGLVPGEVAPAPKGIFPKYDIDAFLKYSYKAFKNGEEVIITEKIHGCNAKFIFQDGKMHCGSREQWKKEYSSPPNLTLEDLITRMNDENKAKEAFAHAVTNFKPKRSMWWALLDNTPSIHKFCEANPNYCLYGEIYGNVKGFSYDAKEKEILFRAFDILVPADPIPYWMGTDEFFETCKKFDIPHVPILGIIPYNFEEVIKLAEGKTTLGEKHIREGCVIKPKGKDRWSEFFGRVALKIVSPQFLEIN